MTRLLMYDNRHQDIVWTIINIVKRKEQFHDTETWTEMILYKSDNVDDILS